MEVAKWARRGAPLAADASQHTSMIRRAGLERKDCSETSLTREAGNPLQLSSLKYRLSEAVSAVSWPVALADLLEGDEIVFQIDQSAAHEQIHCSGSKYIQNF